MRTLLLKFFLLTAMLSCVSSMNAQVQYEEINIASLSSVNSLRIGDLSRDGKNDIAVGLTDGRLFRLAQTATKGVFTSMQVDSYGQPIVVRVARINADIYRDIVVGRAGYGDLHKNVSTGPNTFVYGFVNSYGTYAGPVTADLNRDGLTDIALIRASDGLIHREFQNGLGGLVYGAIAGIGGEQHAITTGHLDATTNSSVNDIVVSRWVPGYGASVYVEFQTGVGTFSEKHIGNYNSVVTDLAVGDFDADGDKDILVVLKNGVVKALLQVGVQIFYEENLLNFDNEIACVSVGDVSSDGLDDLVIGLTNGKVFVALQQSSGDFDTQLVREFTSIAVNDIDIGDINSDSAADFIIGLSDGKIYGYYQVKCIVPLSGDVNGDCRIDSDDIASMLSNWLECSLEVKDACWN